MTAHLSRDVSRRALRPAERERYVRWWLERSGLSERQLRKIATAIWADDDVPFAQRRRYTVMRRV